MPQVQYKWISNKNEQILYINKNVPLFHIFVHAVILFANWNGYISMSKFGYLGNTFVKLSKIYHTLTIYHIWRQAQDYHKIRNLESKIQLQAINPRTTIIERKLWGRDAERLVEHLLQFRMVHLTCYWQLWQLFCLNIAGNIYFGLLWWTNDFFL